jgi:hypothetical protein
MNPLVKNNDLLVEGKFHKHKNNGNTNLHTYPERRRRLYNPLTDLDV